MINNTFLIGAKTEHECVAKFLELGCMVSLPVSHFSTYDMIVDIGNNILLKVQCKTSQPSAGGFSFHCTSTRINTKGVSVHKYSPDEVNYIATVFDNRLYMVNIDECVEHKTLRLDIPKNLQTNNLNWAVNYEADYVIAKLRGDDVLPRIDMDAKLKEIKFNITPQLSPDYKYTYRWITDGIHNKKFYGNESDIPDGFRLGRV